MQLGENYFELLKQPEYLYANGVVIIDRNVSLDTFQKGLEWLHLIVNGEIYSPSHLAGAVTAALTKAGGDAAEIHIYEYAPPRFEKGTLLLTNAYLESAEESLYLVVNGTLQLSKDLNMEQFAAQIDRLCVNGKAVVYEEQSAYFYKKNSSFSSCSVQLIPAGYEFLTKPLRLNARSIRRLNGHKLFTRKPIVIEADVSREALSHAIADIKSSSFIICSEDVEDLAFERCPDLDTEILSFEHSFVWIEDEETWSRDQFLALDQPVNFIVNGELILDGDVTDDVLKEKIQAIDLFGEIIIPEKRIKAVLYPYLRVNSGGIIEKGTEEEFLGMGNVGMLSL
ncbi:hypothetical protein [Paenibacillus caui]|uniref:hypothetical protein n=1 Tax=Paenibacillus caui TaxID=2873927 RepID=UPI001CAA0710|nr:hypothetical protein [Paenibacillus caui]